MPGSFFEHSKDRELDATSLEEPRPRSPREPAIVKRPVLLDALRAVYTGGGGGPVDGPESESLVRPRSRPDRGVPGLTIAS